MSFENLPNTKEDIMISMLDADAFKVKIQKARSNLLSMVYAIYIGKIFKIVPNIFDISEFVFGPKEIVIGYNIYTYLSDGTKIHLGYFSLGRPSTKELMKTLGDKKDDFIKAANKRLFTSSD